MARWTGHNPAELIIPITVWSKNLQEGAADDLAAAVEYGGNALQDNLEAAVTPTGQRRAEKGGFPGRHLTGNMVGSIGYTERNEISTKDQPMFAFFGWFPKYFEQYFRDQDLGEDGVSNAARAMNPAFIAAREFLRARLQKRVK